MVEVTPFKGIIYNKKKIDKLDDVMSPPYDIISQDMQTDLYRKNQYNFIRLILGKQNSNDTNYNNRYSRAKKLFDSWIKESIMIESDRKCIFPYKIEYELKWYETIAAADPIKNYWVHRINNDEAYDTCGFVYEAGSYEMGGRNHIHIPSDSKVINSPEYEEWFWICL